MSHSLFITSRDLTAINSRSYVIFHVQDFLLHYFILLQQLLNFYL